MLAYMLRRTRGTGLYRDGVDFAAISVLLGHADMKTTRDHYTTPSLEQLRETLFVKVVVSKNRL